MRNHLAEDVLDNNMLNLFLNIKEAPQGGDGTKFDSAIALLQQTSIIPVFSHDKRKFVLLEDDKLHTLLRVNRWFKDWESSILSQSDVPMPARNKMLMSFRGNAIAHNLLALLKNHTLFIPDGTTCKKTFKINNSWFECEQHMPSCGTSWHGNLLITCRWLVSHDCKCCSQTFDIYIHIWKSKAN